MSHFKKLNQRGTTLVEILMIVMTAGILVALIANIPPSINLIGRSRHQSIANQIANKQIEDLRAVSFENLANGDSQVTDTRIDLLPSGDGTISVTDCDTVNICTNNEEAKQVKVTINWIEGVKPQSVELQTLITLGGLK